MPQREPTLDAQGLLRLTRDECLGMVTSVAVGRLVFVDDEGPIALPVNHVIHHGDVVFRIAAGSKLDAARSASGRAAFEVDEFDDEQETGWSVLIRGALEVITDEQALASLRGLALRPWADEVARDHWLRVTADEVTGRRLIPRGAASPP